MNFLRLGIGLLDSLQRHRNDSEYINITICSNISLKFAIDFVLILFIFELIRPRFFFSSCRYNTAPISITKVGFQIFLKWVYLKGSNFALKVEASRAFAMIIFLFSLFDCFSIFLDDFVCFGWHYSIDLLARVLLCFSCISLNCISGFVLLCFLIFYFVVLIFFRFTLIHSLFN